METSAVSKPLRSPRVIEKIQYFVKTGLIETEYAKILGRAFDHCLDSDYNVSFTAEQTLAENVLYDAQRFVDRAEQYLHQMGAL